MSLGQKYKELGVMAVRRELTLINAAAFPVLLSFVAMYAALGPLLQTQVGLMLLLAALLLIAAPLVAISSRRTVDATV